ncbi:MAG: hypothetical protein ABSE55_16350 [Terracidiphilus sp.]
MKMRFAANVLGMVLLGVAMPIGAAFGQQGDAASNNPSEALKEFLRSYLNPGPDDHKEAIRITVVSVKTEDKAGEEEIVYISGPQGTWCGTGGCMMLILEPFQSSFKVLGRVTIVQLPIRLLPSRKHRHPDIGVWVQGGGIQPGYEAVVSFDGTNYSATYSDNLSTPPAQPVNGIKGKKIITTTDNSIPLYE